jgi:stalled ribosome rescue protein Dom34
MVIEQFLTQLNSIHKQFQLQIFLNNSESIQSIIDIALNHLQQSTNTIQIIYTYGINLLQRAEHHSNKEQKQNIQAFATKIIKQ